MFHPSLILTQPHREPRCHHPSFQRKYNNPQRGFSRRVLVEVVSKVANTISNVCSRQPQQQQQQQQYCGDYPRDTLISILVGNIVNMYVCVCALATVYEKMPRVYNRMNWVVKERPILVVRPMKCMCLVCCGTGERKKGRLFSLL